MFFSWPVGLAKIVLAQHLSVSAPQDQMPRESRKPGFEESRREKIIGMKRILGFFILSFTLTLSSKAQITNDGYVTNNLSVDLSKATIVSYLTGLEKRISDYKSGAFSSTEDVYSQTGINLGILPRLEQLCEESLNGNGLHGISTTFLVSIRDQINKIGNDYQTVGDLRNGFLSLTNSMSLKEKEKEFLALLDISVQAVVKGFLQETMDEIGLLDNVMNTSNTYTSFNTGESVESNYNVVNNIEFKKLPRWFVCVVVLAALLV